MPEVADLEAEIDRLKKALTGERRKRRAHYCGCMWCCADMPPGTKDRGEGHHGCPAAREPDA